MIKTKISGYIASGIFRTVCKNGSTLCIKFIPNLLVVPPNLRWVVIKVYIYSGKIIANFGLYCLGPDLVILYF